MTTSTILTSYARWWRTTGRSPETLRNYVYSLERLAHRLGGQRQLADARLADLRDYLGDRLEATSPGTASVDFRAMRSFYGWLVEEGELDVNPAAKLRGPKVAETPVKVAGELDTSLYSIIPQRACVPCLSRARRGLLWSALECHTVARDTR